MTTEPKALRDLQALWVAHGGVPLGIAGDSRHVATGTSYHLGKAELKPGAYSAVLARDVTGLSEAASAIDLGKLHGSYFYLQAFSRWFVKQVQDHPTFYRDVREVIYSPDGTHVYNWDNHGRALHLAGDGTGWGSSAHLEHTHISAYRDSEFRPKTQWFTAYFAAGSPVPPPVTAPEVDVPGLGFQLKVTLDPNPWNDVGHTRLLPTARNVIRVRDRKIVALAAGADLGIVTRAQLIAPFDKLGTAEQRSAVYLFNHNDGVTNEAHAAIQMDCTPFVWLVDPTPGTASAADVEAAKAKAAEEVKARAIAAVQAI